MIQKNLIIISGTEPRFLCWEIKLTVSYIDNSCYWTLNVLKGKKVSQKKNHTYYLFFWDKLYVLGPGRLKQEAKVWLELNIYGTGRVKDVYVCYMTRGWSMLRIECFYQIWKQIMSSVLNVFICSCTPKAGMIVALMVPQHKIILIMSLN